MRWVVIFMCTGCWTGPAPVANTTPPSAAPVVELVIAHGRIVRFVEVSSRGARVTATITAPSQIGALAWVGAEPVAMLLANPYSEEDPGDATLDGVIGRITRRGFERYPELPAATWSQLPNLAGYPDHFEVSRWLMIQSADAAVWQGHCVWALEFDGQACTKWLWARIDKPGATTFEVPKGTWPKFPRIPPPPAIKVELREHQPDPAGDTMERVHCESSTGAFDYPSDADFEFGIEPTEGITWISRNPPLYRVVHARGGFAGIMEPVILEGCGESRDWKAAKVAGGPHETLALYTPDKLSVRWKGDELGALAIGGTAIAFAPARGELASAGTSRRIGR